MPHLPDSPDDKREKSASAAQPLLGRVVDHDLPVASTDDDVNVNVPTRVDAHTRNHSAISRKRSRTAWTRPTTMLAAVGLAALAVGALWSASTDARLSSSRAAAADESTLPAPFERVWLRAVQDNHAGLGSVVGQTRLAALLARAVEAELVIPTRLTEHGYAASRYLNRVERATVDTSNVCVLSGRLAARNATAESLASDAEEFCRTGTVSDDLAALRDCTVVVDDRPWEFRRDLGECTMDWWDSIIRVPEPPAQVASTVTVAVHVRWGDTQNRIGFDTVTHNATLRSTPLSVANPIINALASCARPLDVHVFMEGGDAADFPLDHAFTLHDGGDGVDPIDDLRDMAAADVRVTALGGYATLVHWSAKHGLSIVPSRTDNSPPYYLGNKRIHVAYQGELVAGGKHVCEVLEDALQPHE